MILGIQNKTAPSFGTLQIKKCALKEGGCTQTVKDLKSVYNRLVIKTGINYNTPSDFKSELDCAQRFDNQFRKDLNQSTCVVNSFMDAQYITAQPEPEMRIKWKLRNKKGYDVKHLTR